MQSCVSSLDKKAHRLKRRHECDTSDKERTDWIIVVAVVVVMMMASRRRRNTRPQPSTVVEDRMYFCVAEMDFHRICIFSVSSPWTRV